MSKVCPCSLYMMPTADMDLKGCASLEDDNVNQLKGIFPGLKFARCDADV